MIENEFISSLRDFIRRWPRGRIFFLEDLADVGDPLLVRHYMTALVEEGFIIRLARGIYCYPRIEGEFGVRVVIPDPETVAYALAARENVRIIPYGDRAACRLGLSGIVLSSYKYLTDGSSRVVNLSAKTKIFFNHTSEVKVFAYRNETMQLLCSAVRVLGREAFEDEGRKRKVREILADVPEEMYREDLKLPPVWVADILENIRAVY